ncbi:MAG: hypothetical protein HUU04_00815 [Verrucomicrobiae bacterium]|nr:hypothetical protein [Verrucomicrobiae bacterium]
MRIIWFLLFGLFGLGPTRVAAEDHFEPGGPLQGVKLPRFPTQHGEKPGYPGVIPELQTRDATGNLLFTAEALPPEHQLFDGSVEHFRAYFFKYLPVKSFFDRQSLIKNWLARDLLPQQAEDYAEPVYWVPRHAAERPTGRFNRPVRVVRGRVKTTVFDLAAGHLPAGMYAVRVIGAVETKDLIRHRKPLILRLTVNDGLKGEKNTSRFRCKYVDEFYVLAEFYFHAPEARAYHLTLAVDEGTQVTPLIHNLELHDALAGATHRAIKTKTTLTSPLGKPPQPPVTDAARLQRDADLWGAIPPLNAQFGITYGMGGDDPKKNWPNIGAGGLTSEQIQAQYGEWKLAPLGPLLLQNAKLQLTYAIADLAAGKPLPDPYPFKDRGLGVYTPPSKTEETPQNWCPIANGVRDRVRTAVEEIKKRTLQFDKNGDVNAGRDAAVLLCRLAYDYPGYDSSNDLSALMVQPGAYGRDMGCRRRDPRSNYFPVDFLDNYDRLFELIKSDPGLPQSVGRFVPWIKTPQDVIRLLDVYLVQTMAKRWLRYHYYYANEPTKILRPVRVLGDPHVTNPWMEWLFSSTFLYPQPPSGLQDLLVTGNDRDGIGYIGSFYYCGSEQCAPKAAELEDYLAEGGDPKFDLRDPRRYPKPVAACRWFVDTRMAGLFWPRIGDVGGPDKTYGAWFDHFKEMAPLGWRWTKEAQFAFIIKHFWGRGDFKDAEWAEIEKAAATLKRAPWLETPSRVVANWFGLLETGRPHDDPRFRRNVYLRIGLGHGHAHADSLDLQGHAHGYPFTIDGGQRSGYSSPADFTTRIHNLVEIDGKNMRTHSWVTALSDAEGARYLAAELVPPGNHPNLKLYRRQVALLDVDEPGEPQSLPVPQTGPNAKDLPPLTASPISYIFDVVRVSGGGTNTYCFHGPIEDEMTTNIRETIQGMANLKAEADKEYLKIFPEAELVTAGTAPEILEATWRLSREPNLTGGRGFGVEKGMHAAIWDEASPRKFTRLHLLGVAGARTMTGRLVCKQWKYVFTNLLVQKRLPTAGDTVFTALIEPYVGEPFLTDRQLLPIAGNETDARQAVAVQVKTKNGHTDLLFADGSPEKTREFSWAGGPCRVAAEFASVSMNAQRLRVAAITGGTLLQTPEVLLRPVRRELTATIKATDYPEKTVTLDPVWIEAPLSAGRVVEFSNGQRPVTYTIRQAIVANGQTRLILTGGADYFLSRVTSVDAAAKQLRCALAPPYVTKENTDPIPRINHRWTASTESGGKTWRADYVGMDSDTNEYLFQLDGAVNESDFGKGGGFRLWEYGTGDQVRRSTAASLRYVTDKIYELTTDAEIAVGLKGGRLEISVDRQTWKELPAKAVGGKVEATISLATLLSAQGRVFLRVQ